MIDKLIDRVASGIELQQSFDAETLKLHTNTWLLGNLVHVHSFDMQPIYEAFAARMVREVPYDE